MKILTGALVHRVTRPLRGSVSCGSGQLGMRSRVSFLADLLAYVEIFSKIEVLYGSVLEVKSICAVTAYGTSRERLWGARDATARAFTGQGRLSVRIPKIQNTAAYTVAMAASYTVTTPVTRKTQKIKVDTRLSGPKRGVGPNI